MIRRLKNKFSLDVPGLEDETLLVVKFQGKERLSGLFQFQLLLMTKELNLRHEDILNKQATLSMHHEGGPSYFSGTLVSLEQRSESHGYAFFQTTLVPNLWWLTQCRHNQIFLDNTLPEIISQVLEEAQIKQGPDFDLRLQSTYEPRAYVCQYNETHFNFFSRWLERDGLYYYFEHKPGREKAIITDNIIAHTPVSETSTMMYSPKTGLEKSDAAHIIPKMSLKTRVLPEKLITKDWNYRYPQVELLSHAQVDPAGRGEVYLYGDHIKNTAEGALLANIRAQELLSSKNRYSGESTAPALRSGHTFRLSGHYRQDFNQEYLLTEVEHQGCQEAFVMAKCGVPMAKGDNAYFYRNQFHAIPAGVQYRPKRSAEKARFYGHMNAHIDGPGEATYAHVDDQGRYKVILPFDLSGKQDGKASAFVRMLQPYAGAGHGLHLPLHKGAEVLLCFIDGDPDRPVIAGAVPNPENPSVLTSQNQSQALLTTSGQNKLHMEDQEGNQRMLLSSPTANSWVRIGSPNDPPGLMDTLGQTDTFYASNDSSSGQSITTDTPKKGLYFNTDECMTITAGNTATTVAGTSTNTVLGASTTTHAGLTTNLTFGGVIEYSQAIGWSKHLSVSHNATKSITLKVSPTNMQLTPYSIKGNTETYEMLAGEDATIDAGGAISLTGGGDATLTGGGDASVSGGGDLTLSASEIVSIQATGDTNITSSGVTITADETVTITASTINLVGDVNVEGVLSTTGVATVGGALTVEGVVTSEALDVEE